MIPSGPKKPEDPEQITVPPDRGSPAEQPKWRRDFPIDWAQDDWVSRRDLVKFIVLTSAAFAAGQGWIALRSLFRPRRADTPVTPVAELDEVPVGGAKVFEYPEGSSPRLLVRRGEADFVAYDQQCTHLMCPVVPVVEEGRLHCPCHSGWFDLATGQPLAGPPRRALPRIELEVRDGRVYATGVVEPAS
jgi:nitrite reductase/ring-hydroxylating ferredoxin subunit